MSLSLQPFGPKSSAPWGVGIVSVFRSKRIFFKESVWFRV